jgi:uncharacterized repeat protein (TIGR01451 family)
MYKIVFIFLGLFIFGWTKGVPAGTQIANTAQLGYTVNGYDFNTTSNTVVDVVDQVLNLDLVCQETQNIIVQSGETKRALAFVLENTGNGTDRFDLLPDTNASSAEVDNRLIYLDDGDGVFNSADTQINDINLTADAKAILFFVSNIPSNAAWHYSHNGIKARSSIGGSSIPGTDYNITNGTDSYYAVDGQKGGVDNALCTYEMNNLNLLLKKTATLSSNKLYTGTTVHYKIEVTVEGEGTATSIVVKDMIPSGTTYVNNTIRLDGVAVPDSGHFISNSLSVPVGDMTKIDKHEVEFDVKVD